MARRREARRAISISELRATKFNQLDFDGQWLAAMGKPELSGTILIYGPPKNGKTRLSLQFAKYLTRFERVAYDALEMGVGVSLQEAIDQTNFSPVEEKRILLLDREPISEVRTRLLKKKSPNILFIDSLQYTGLSYRDYVVFKEEFYNRMKIFLSHADGKQPRGEVAKSVQYDADIIIRVEGFKAYTMSRYGGGETITIWEEGAAKF
jgi:DNA-dependent RNA polymerase auxiliary subunit epsilon